METPSAWRSGHAPLNALALLGLSFGAAGLAGAGVALWLGGARIALSTLLAASAGAAILVGLALTLALLLRLAQLDRTLAQLAGGDTSASRANQSTLAGHGWPLAAVFERVAVVRERVSQAAERERQAVAYRDEVMRQVSDAAAREERNRLARELHDSIKQQLFSIGVSAAAARARAGESDALAALDDIQRGAREAQVEMTALLQQLRPAPLENVGLVEALRDQCEALGYRTGAEVQVTIGALPTEDRLPPRAQEQLFRMAQEALANIARHARAQHVWLRLERQGDAMLLEIRDDGQGFDAAAAHAGMGLSNLHERATALGGVAEIQSAPGQGTIIRIHAPLIEPLHATPEEVERQAAIATTLRDGERWLGRCMLALQIACALIFFDLPIWSVALAIVATSYLYMLSRRAQLEVARLAGRGSEPDLTLRHRALELLTWLLILLGLCLWYLPVSAPHGWMSGAMLGGVVAASALLLALGALCWERWRRATDRYFRLLPSARRRSAIRKRRDETLGVAVTVGVIIGLGLLFGGWAPAWPPHSATQWSDTASVALLILLCFALVIELWLSWRWRRALIGAGGSEAVT